LGGWWVGQKPGVCITLHKTASLLQLPRGAAPPQNALAAKLQASTNGQELLHMCGLVGWSRYAVCAWKPHAASLPA
jgi:hypothetical protein